MIVVLAANLRRSLSSLRGQEEFRSWELKIQFWCQIVTWAVSYDESERGSKFDLATRSTAVVNHSITSVGRIDFRWRFRWFCWTHFALQTPRNTNVIGKVFDSTYALVWWPCEGWIVVFEGLFSGHSGGRRGAVSSLPLFLTVPAYRDRDIERSELKLLQRQGNTHRNKVCKFKLYYSSKFRVLRSTKISNTFLHNSKPRDVIQAWAACDVILLIQHHVPSFHSNTQTFDLIFNSNLQLQNPLFSTILLTVWDPIRKIPSRNPMWWTKRNWHLW